MKLLKVDAEHHANHKEWLFMSDITMIAFSIYIILIAAGYEKTPMYGVGAGLMFVSLYGLVTAVFAKKWMLVVYAILAVAFTIGASIYLVFFVQIDISEYKKEMYDSLSLYNDTEMGDKGDLVQKEESTTEYWDDLQHRYRCCGVVNYSDWWTGNDSKFTANEVPLSCCQDDRKKECENKDLEFDVARIYRKGCFDEDSFGRGRTIAIVFFSLSDILSLATVGVSLLLIFSKLVDDEDESESISKDEEEQIGTVESEKPEEEQNEIEKEKLEKHGPQEEHIPTEEQAPQEEQVPQEKQVLPEEQGPQEDETPPIEQVPHEKQALQKKKALRKRKTLQKKKALLKDHMSEESKPKLYECLSQALI